jgi:hypothetical protein
MVGDFTISSSPEFRMMEPKGRVSFKAAPNAKTTGYEMHVNFVYFEVDKKTNQVVKLGKVGKNVMPRVGEELLPNAIGDLTKEFIQTFYVDIAAQLEKNPDVTRYMGRPGNNGACIEVEGWAAGEDMIKFLLSNQPTNSFVQINTLYTNVKASDGLAFGFLSSKVKSSSRDFNVNPASEKELVEGPITGHLGFRPFTEYKP